MRSVLASSFAVALLVPALLPPGAPAKSYEDLAVDLLREYLQIDTTVPPGNELRAALFYQRLLEREGITAEVDEFTPGRANLMAVLPGSGARKPLILMNHMDVVPA
ncbi:MAG TPA: peptidase M20, partial [Methylomirabilota bacterium]|nr:peptidase M20 [Methylomirabilota bacterium]